MKRITFWLVAILITSAAASNLVGAQDDTVTQPKILLNSKGLSHLSYTPDGKTLVGACPDGVVFWDAETGKEKRTLSGLKLEHFLFTGDGKSLIGWGSKSPMEVIIWNVADNRETKRIKVSQEYCSISDLATDGNRMLAVAWGTPHSNAIKQIRSVSLIDMTSGKQTELDDQYQIAGQDVVTFSPDGKSLAVGKSNYGYSSGSVAVWELGTETNKKVRTYGSGPCTSLLFSTDGKMLAAGCGAVEDFGGHRKSVGQVELYEVETGKRLAAGGQPGHCWFLAFGPGGDSIIAGSRRVYGNSLLLWNRDLSKVLGGQSLKLDFYRPSSSATLRSDGQVLAFTTRRTFDGSTPTPIYTINYKDIFAKSKMGK